MTINNQNSTVTYDGNGVTTLWPYDFIIPDDGSARVGLFEISTNVLTTLSDTDYSMTGIDDPNGGEVTYPLIGDPIAATYRLVIWREVEYTQDTELTNQTPYYPKVLETQLDRIVMQIQQLAAEAVRSIKVTLGSNLTPDQFVADLQEGAAEAQQSADAAAASAQAAANSAALTELPNPAVALNMLRRNAGNTAYENRTPSQVVDDIKAVRYDLASSLTALQAGQARGNIGADILAGFRNKIINGDFDIWQRGSPISSLTGYSADRWSGNSSSTGSISRQTHTPGQTDVPGNPKSFLRLVKSSTADYALLRQRIEGVNTLAGRTVTLTFYAKINSAVTGRVIVTQRFGTGGTPSAAVDSLDVSTITLTTNWQKFSYTFTLASIAGKSLGSNGDDSLEINFYPNGTSSSWVGTFDLSRVSLVEGDATAEADPFSPRHIAQEWMLCERYFRRRVFRALRTTTAVGQYLSVTFDVSGMRVLPSQATEGADALTGIGPLTTVIDGSTGYAQIYGQSTAASGGQAFTAVRQLDAEL